MWTDPIVSEIHKVRSEIAAEHGNDLRKIGAYFIERQKEDLAKLVKFQSRPGENTKRLPKPLWLNSEKPRRIEVGNGKHHHHRRCRRSQKHRSARQSQPWPDRRSHQRFATEKLQERVAKLAGGGVALLRARPAVKVKGTMGKNRADQDAGVKIVLRAVAKPLRVIVANAGDEPRRGGCQGTRRQSNFSYNAALGTYGEMLERGVVDPT
jgi:hypothetical protein